MPIILDGKSVASKIKKEIKNEVLHMKHKPGLGVILVGDDPASQIYVKGKEKDCEECGFTSIIHRYPSDVTEKVLLQCIEEMNFDYNIDGILIQLPLPVNIDKHKIIESILVNKDADCFHPYNQGMIMNGQAEIYPCTPSGIIRLLEDYDIDLTGKHCVIINRSTIVGKPLSMMMLECNATVTVCHSYTKDLESYSKDADIIVTAVGHKDFITGDMIKENCIIVDVSMNRIDGKLYGDCTQEAYDKSSYYTPVPGGVGPMTRAMLMLNTLRLAKLHMK